MKSKLSNHMNEKILRLGCLYSSNAMNGFCTIWMELERNNMISWKCIIHKRSRYVCNTFESVCGGRRWFLVHSTRGKLKIQLRVEMTFQRIFTCCHYLLWVFIFNNIVLFHKQKMQINNILNMNKLFVPFFIHQCNASPKI